MINDINTLADYLGPRDLPTLTPAALEGKYGIPQADAFVLFGGSILPGGDVFAAAKKAEIAKKYIIVGGHGHTTDGLRAQAKAVFPDLDVDSLSEAEIFAAYVQRKYQITADLLECQSTNSGNNITYLLDLLNRHNIDLSSVILCQDATMQLRLSAVLRKYRPELTIINYAAYQVHVLEKDGQLAYDKEIPGMWPMDRYISLLMGEIPRLRDNKDGYGPLGKDYIAHVDLPASVERAFSRLRKEYGGSVRQANPAYKS
ncbi:hypothetical protein BTI79_05570 [Lactobacillus delbrueckii subsp. bulgaricus]|nr:hypothetical protein [Lactobacillus delbrueckii subsp. bulgaricus]